MSTTRVLPRRYRIAEVGRLTGFTPSTLRFYENAGVLSPPARTDAGYRLYDDRDVERLRLISRAKELGCTLDEIAGLVQAWDADECAPVKHQLRNLVLSKVAEVRDHIASQVAFAAQLEATAADLTTRPVDGPCDDSCGCATLAPASNPAQLEAEVGGCGPACGCGTADEPSGPTAVAFLSHGADDRPPIACALGAGDMEARVAEWHAVLAHVADRTPVPDGLQLTFGPNPPLAEITRLVAAEVSCCSFFVMTLGFDRHGVTLTVTAPADGQPLLRDLFAAAS